MTSQPDELIKCAVFRDSIDAQRELFKLAESYAAEKDYKTAADLYRESAIAYRLSAARARTRAGEAESESRWYKLVNDLRTIWENVYRERSPKLPYLLEGLTEDLIRDLSLEVFDDPEFRSHIIYLDRILSDKGVVFCSPGGSLQRRVWNLMSSYFERGYGHIKSFFDTAYYHTFRTYGEQVDVDMNSVDMRIALDPIAFELVRRFEALNSNDETPNPPQTTSEDKSNPE